MTELVSSAVKLQQKSPPTSKRRVCILQHNRSTVSLVPQAKANESQQSVPSAFLLSDTSCLTSSSLYVRAPSQISPYSSFLMPIQQVLPPKPSIKTLKNNITTTVKSVRFNMPLTRTLHFYTPPAFDDDSDDDDEDNEECKKLEEEEEDKLEDAFLESFSNRLTASSPHATHFASNLFHPAIQQHILDSSSANNLRLILSNWLPIHPARYMMQAVTLEDISWENTRGIIKGRILVCNLAFEKKVTVRATFDCWKSWSDINAIYAGSFKNGALDVFTYELKPTPRIINTKSQCSLAVRYQVNGGEFWDNNNGNNFNLLWTTSSCGKISNRIGETTAQEAVTTNVTSTVTAAASKTRALSLNLQGQSTTKTLPSIGSQEEMKNRKKEEEHIVSSMTPQFNADFYIHQTVLYNNNGRSMFDSLLSPPTTTQQQISAHFQLYLERKRRSEARQQQKKEKYNNSIHDQHRLTENTMAELAAPSQQMLPPNRSEVLLLI